MARWITRDDFIETYFKARQRGLRFILSKFNIRSRQRTISAFDKTSFDSANWWILPEVNQRWNRKITGHASHSYEQLLAEDYLTGRSGINLLSVGCGPGHHEIELGQYKCFGKITGIDISSDHLEIARNNAELGGVSDRVEFRQEDFYEVLKSRAKYDVILFNASLHHLDNIRMLLTEQIPKILSADGLLVINEYVGPDRLQLSRSRREFINKTLNGVPEKYRTRLGSSQIKTSFSGAGLLRMILADPSECIDSSSIMPTLHDHYKTLCEKPYGGNIAPYVLKDIAHNFLNADDEGYNALKSIFKADDRWMRNHASDFVFGVFKW